MEKTKTVATVSRSNTRLQYDAFLSFRGADTRHNITEAIYDELHRKERVRVFRDNEGMKRGDVISPSLVAAIENSAGSVIVISPQYANSRWCLDELVQISDLSSSLRRPMIPIFYMVNPSHVRKQNHHFAEDFAEHAKSFEEERIQGWKRAMNFVGNLSGFVFRDFGKDLSVDNAMLKLVVKKVLAELSNNPEKVGAYTVGIESRVDDLMKLFDVEASSGVQVLGLYGVGGIGKTTLAKAFYNKIVVNFEEHRVFISNVGERSSGRDGLINLQKTYINEVFGLVPEIEDVKRGCEKIRESVYEKKILVVLDDVDNVDQVDAVVGERRWYGEGSLIVITTRDKEILKRLAVNKEYEVKCLTETEAVKLFSYHSLRKEKPIESQMKLFSEHPIKKEEILSMFYKKIVKITGLLPLAVEVFGSLFYDKKEEKEWKSQLEKLEKVKRNQQIGLEDVLALSFESLDDEEKKLFLDIACLFLGTDTTKEEVVDILKGYGFNAEASLSVLIQKSLVKIMEDGTLWMHDQTRDMGREMIRKENREDPCGRSRLWDHSEIMTVLNDTKGTTSIRGIVFDFKNKFRRETSAEDNPAGINSFFSYLKNTFIPFRVTEKPKDSEITIRVESFASMKKLKLLRINHVELEGNLILLPAELMCIQWKGCPLETVPSDFLARQLAVLDLSESGIKRFQSLPSKGKAVMDGNLKIVNFRGCDRLEAIPDLSNHESIEKLNLEGCVLLEKVPSQVGNLNKLIHLDLRNCTKLVEFLDDVSGLKKLERLLLSGCSTLRVLPENIGAMACLKELLLDGTAIKYLPESVYRLGNLVKLSLKSCGFIQKLPSPIGSLTSLEELYLDETALRELPFIGNLKNLEKLHLVRCRSFSKIPESINELISLKELFIDGTAVTELPLEYGSLPCLTDFSACDCRFLKHIPHSVSGLNSLLQLKLDNTPIETLPEKIGDLHFIRVLKLQNCKSLKGLPKSIGDIDTLQRLYLDGSNIEELPEAFGELENLVELRMNNCVMLKRLPETFGSLKSLCRLYMNETSVAELPESFGNLSKLKVLKMLKTKKTDLRCNKVLPPNSFSNLFSLDELDAYGWGISGKVPDVFKYLSSMKILNLGNNYFHSLPDSLEGLTNLRELLLRGCRELKSLPRLPRKLERLKLANCFALASIADLSDLMSLRELDLTNCESLCDIPGLEHLTSLKRLYISGCNSKCSRSVKTILSKASLKMLRYISLPGNKIPSWFSQGAVTFSATPNRELIGVILAFVVSLNNETTVGDSQLVMEVQAQIRKLDRVLYTDTFHVSVVRRTSNDHQVHICQYSALHPMVTMLKDGCTIAIKREPSTERVELKMSGIHLVYEEEEANDITHSKEDQTVSRNFAEIVHTFEEG